MIEKNKLKLLHGLRGFASLIVVIAHAKFPFWSGGTVYLEKYPRSEWNIFEYFLFGIDMFTSNATNMVIVFFVLSGFFIAYSFRMNNWKVQHFYVNRAIRVYTPYFGSILFTIICFKLATFINPDLFHSFNPREYNQDLNAAFQNFNFNTLMWTSIFRSHHGYLGYNYPYWSLLVEVYFYFIAPLIVYKPKVFFLLSIPVTFIYSMFPEIFPNINFIVMLFPYMFYFALGIIVFWLIFDFNLKEKIKNVNLWVFNIVIILLLLIGQFIGFYSLKLGYFLSAIFASFLIIRLSVFPFKENILSKIFIFLGKISFTLYLIHVPLFILLYSLLVKYTGQEVFYSRIYWIPVLIAVLISIPLYNILEKPSLSIIRKYKQIINQ